MAQFTTNQQAVTNAAVQLNSGSSTNFTTGIKLTCVSTSTASAFYGPAGVSITTGDELPPGTSVVLPINDISSIYIIAAANSTTVLSWLGIY